jgi:hypothetical protein
LTTDASNCGSCGHGCDGGICVAGQCALASSIQFLAVNVVDIALDGVNLYYIGGANDVWQVNKTTLATTPLAANQANPYRIATDGTYVYWTSNLGSALLRAPVGGATPAQVIYPAQGPTSIAVDATNVYWSDPAGTHSAPKAGGGAVATLSTTATSGEWTQDATSLYGWQLVPSVGPNVGVVFSLNKSTGAYVEYAHGIGSYPPKTYSGAAVDGERVYFLGSSLDIPYTYMDWTTRSAPMSIQGQALPWGGSDIAAENCVIYVSSGHFIFKEVPGAPAHALTTAAVSAGHLVLDDKYVYWIDKGFIGRVPK